MNTQNNVTPKQWSISNGKLKLFYILANIFWVLTLVFNIYGTVFENEGLVDLYYIFNFLITALFGFISNLILLFVLRKKKIILFYAISIIVVILGFLLFWDMIDVIFDV